PGATSCRRQRRRSARTVAAWAGRTSPGGTKRPAGGRRRASRAGARPAGSPRDLRDRPRGQRLQEPARARRLEPRVLRLDAQEETVARGEAEARDVEQRVVRGRQVVER